MKLNRLRCPNCGADFENVDVTEDQKLFKCTRLGCGATFVLDQGVRFADVKQAEAEKIGHFREEMKLALYPFDRHLAGHYAEDILTIIPDGSLPSPGTDVGLTAGETQGKPMLTVSRIEDVPRILAWLNGLPDGRIFDNAMELVQRVLPRCALVSLRVHEG